MVKNNTFFQRLEKNSNKLTKKQAKLADYILKNYKTAAFLSSIPLGKEAGVSEATVIRFARALGYHGFIDMIRDIQDYVKNEITTIDKLEKLEKEYQNKTVFDEVINNNLLIINSIKKNIREKEINEIIKEMSNSKKIIFIGFESSAGIAEYVGYNFVRVASDVEIITERHGNVFNVIKNIDSKTFVIIMAFPRYSKKVVELAKIFHNNNAKLLCITDSISSPILKYGDYKVIIPKHDNYVSNLDVSVGLITLFQVIFFQYGLKNYSKIKENLEKLEKFNKDYDVFYK